MSSTSASSPAASNSCPSPSEGFIWDVQEILAERTSINGGNEVLVVMKTAWVPVNQMIADCPAMQRWRDTGRGISALTQRPIASSCRFNLDQCSPGTTLQTKNCLLLQLPNATFAVQLLLRLMPIHAHAAAVSLPIQLMMKTTERAMFAVTCLRPAGDNTRALTVTFVNDVQ